jgi:hypothetical protein
MEVPSGIFPDLRSCVKHSQKQWNMTKIAAQGRRGGYIVICVSKNNVFIEIKGSK